MMMERALNANLGVSLVQMVLLATAVKITNTSTPHIYAKNVMIIAQAAQINSFVALVQKATFLVKILQL